VSASRGDSEPVTDFDDDPPDTRLPKPPSEKAAKARAKAIREGAERAAGRSKMGTFLAVLDDYMLSTSSPVAFIARDGNKLIGMEAFNATNNPFTAQMKIDTRYKDNAAKYTISLPFGKIERVTGICYRPGVGDKVIDGKVNMWIKPPIEPLDEVPKIFLEHVEYLIPNKVERELMLNWLAHCVQKPMVKLMFALLIVDEKGRTGKSWFGYMMEVILGEANVTSLEDLDPIMDGFNAWSFNKMFGFIHEILPGGKTNVALKLRGTITENKRKVNMKNVERFDAENRINIMCATNFPNAVKLMQDDGRWLVVKGATDKRFCDDLGKSTDQTVEYYERLFQCIGTPSEPGDEARRILSWFMKRDLSKFNGQAAAPQTDAKTMVADVTQGNWAAWFNEAKAAKRKPFNRELFTAAEALAALSLRNATAAQADARSPALSAALIEAGNRKIDKQVRLNDGTQPRLWTLTPGLAANYDKMAPTKLARLYTKMVAGEPVEEPEAEAARDEFADMM
jgi:hypothetical protein